MFVPRLYVPELECSEEITLLNKAQSHYCTNVLRLNNNDLIILFNGKGGEYHSRITSIHAKKTSVFVEGFKEVLRESPVSIHLAQGLSRGDRFDFVIQKATELGVTSITPLITHKSHIKLDAQRIGKKHQHWQAVAISAAEQSGRTTIPLIESPVALPEWTSKPFAGQSLFCSIGSSPSLMSITSSSAIRIAIGPESGWATTEETLFKEHHFNAFHLGPRTLRTETAPIVALSLIQAKIGDF